MPDFDTYSPVMPAGIPALPASFLSCILDGISFRRLTEKEDPVISRRRTLAMAGAASAWSTMKPFLKAQNFMQSVGTPIVLKGAVRMGASPAAFMGAFMGARASQKNFDMIEHCNKLGLGGVQWNPPSTDPKEIKAFRQRLETYDMHLVCDPNLPKQKSDLDAFDAQVNEKTRLVVLNSPANPTGGVMPIEDLTHIAVAAQKYDFWVISDEIYARMAYDGLTVPSIVGIAGMKERTIIVDGFSKTYAMTGWRLGYGIMPEPLAERVSLLLTHSVGCTAAFTQIAGIEALTGPQDMVDQMVEIFQVRRNRMVDGLNAIPGVKCQVPQGAFYAFPNVRSFGIPSKELSLRILDQAGVALLSGTDFGPHGEGYLRLCYANSLENIDQALERLAAFFAAL